MNIFVEKYCFVEKIKVTLSMNEKDMGERKVKYNFVVFATYAKLYKYMWQELKDINNAKVFWDKEELLENLSFLEKLLAKIHLNKSINKLVHLPLKKIWYFLGAQKIRFDDNRPICFVWHNHYWTEIENGMVEYLRKVFPKSKHVYFFTDPWMVKKDKIEFLKKKMDIVSVFDPTIAEKYGLNYYPNIYPNKKFKDAPELEYDVFFIGTEKGRKKELHALYEVCKKNSIKAAFYIGKYENEGDEREGIHYIQNKIDYVDVVELTRKSKCILELKVEPDCSCSLRVQEAVILNKLLLTNNSNVYKMPLCENSKHIVCYSKPEDIDWSFLDTYSEVEFRYQGEYSAKKWIERIEEDLENK